MHRSICICALVPSLVTRTRLVLILHQLEASKTTNTGRIAARCLVNSRVVVRGRDTSVDREAQAARLEASALAPPGTQPLLLLPHESATPLQTWVGSTAPLTLIVPDGTWRQANRTRTRIPGLAQVPCVTLPEGATSRYRLRRDAQPHRLATMEAIAIAMGILEGAPIQAALEQLFAIMVERTLWTNGRLGRAEVTGGIPAGAQSHDPLGGVAPRSAAAPETRPVCPDIPEN